MDDPNLEKRRDELSEKLAAKGLLNKASKGNAQAQKTDGMAGTAYAMKLSSEFIAAIFVGFVIGWSLDKVAGISPWGMIIFVILGFCAGILNILRSVGLIAPSKSERGTDMKPSDEPATPPGNAWADDKED